MALLVIFGAGATYDSVNELVNARPYRELQHRQRPPLATSLFSDRSDYQNILNIYPAVKAIVPDLRQRIADGENIEEVLQDLFDSAKPRNVKGVAAARFYINHLIRQTTEAWASKADGMTNYSRLLDYIDDATANSMRQTYLVSFNYDLMIEEALANHGININSINGYIDNSRYKLIKPHGSINWKQVVRFRTIRDDWRSILVEEPETVEYLHQEPYVIDSSIDLSRYEGDTISRVPVIEIPMANKNRFACPQSHLQCLVDGLPQVTHILTVGWRGTEKHFTALLAKYLKGGSIEIVSKSAESCNVVKENLRNAGLENFGYGHF